MYDIPQQIVGKLNGIRFLFKKNASKLTILMWLKQLNTLFEEEKIKIECKIFVCLFYLRSKNK